MYNTTKQDRKNKTLVQETFFSGVNYTAKNFICLPSTTFNDVNLAEKYNCIDKSKTKIIAVEQEKNIVKSIKAKLQGRGYKHAVINDNLTNVGINNEVDLACIDLCGNISADLLFWLRSIRWSNAAQLSFTFMGFGRRSSFFYSLTDMKLPMPKFCGDFIKKTEIDWIIESHCSALTFVLPSIKFHVCKYYNDTGTRMLFLAGYLGGKCPTLKKIKLKQQSLEEKITDLEKASYFYPQQIGGLRISVNRLPAGKRRSSLSKKLDSLLKKYNDSFVV